MVRRILRVMGKVAGGVVAFFAVLIGVIMIGSYLMEDSYEPYKPKDETPTAPVYNSPWDGSVSQVKQWFEDNLKDPDSLEVITWGKVREFRDGYTVLVKYRAANSFGGKVVESKEFVFNGDGEIVALNGI